jgi:hypothetical protein
LTDGQDQLNRHRLLNPRTFGNFPRIKAGSHQTSCVRLPASTIAAIAPELVDRHRATPMRRSAVTEFDPKKK